MDYEYLILSICDAESTIDECTNCPYKGETCNNQCMEVEEVYNPVLQQIIEDAEKRRC